MTDLKSGLPQWNVLSPFWVLTADDYSRALYSGSPPKWSACSPQRFCVSPGQSSQFYMPAVNLPLKSCIHLREAFSHCGSFLFLRKYTEGNFQENLGSQSLSFSRLNLKHIFKFLEDSKMKGKDAKLHVNFSKVQTHVSMHWGAILITH